MSSHATIDAGYLRALGAEQLTALLDRRPDATFAPHPASLSELAERLCDPASVVAALRWLDQPTVQVAEVLAALGGEADHDVLNGLLGVPAGARADDVDRALDTLRDHALLTGDARPRLVEAARHAWPSPLRLGVPAAELTRHRTADELRAYARNLGLKPAGRKAAMLDQVLHALRDPQLVRRVAADAPADARELLLKVAMTGQAVADYNYYSAVYGQPRTPVQWAASRGLLQRGNDWDDGLVMPAEAALTLRGPDWTAPFDPVAPRMPTRAVPAATVAGDAGASGATALRLVSALLDEAGRTPVAVLKAGGVGVRELRRLTKRLGCAEHELRLGLAVTHRAGLLALSGDGGTPTAGYDDWLRDEPADRLATLMLAWWSMPYVPTLESDAAWTPNGTDGGAAALRAAVLGAAAQAAAEEPMSLVDPAALAELVLWRQPYAFPGPHPQRGAVACWREAALLGVVGADAVSAAGRTLLDGGDLAVALADLGTTERTVRIQADLTAIVAGMPSAELAALLDEAADRESRGAASTWRFTPAGVRRALDAGRGADDLLTALAAVATGGVPQPLEYLIRDVARRHGAVRGQEVMCCLRAEDPALLAEIAADRRLRGLGLRTIAPTVLAGAKPLAETLAGLRAAGYAPLAENADGTPVLERPQPRRSAPLDRAATAPSRAATPGRARPLVRSPQESRSDPTELARTLLGRPDVVAAPASPSLAAVRRASRNLSESQARMLAQAVDARLPVSITYVNQAGNVSSRVIQNIELIGGTLYAWCQLRDDERMFNLSRVLAVSPAPAS